MPKDTGIITDYKAHPDENDCLRWLIDTHRWEWGMSDYGDEQSKQEKYHAMGVLENGLLRCFGVKIEHDDGKCKYYRDAREYLK